MHHKPHVGLIDSHTESIGRHHDFRPAVNKILLIVFPFPVRQPRMVFRYRKAVRLQPFPYFLHVFPRQAVHNAALPRMQFQIILHGRIFILRGLYRKIKIGTVKSRRHHLRVLQKQDIDDIIPHFLRRRRRKGADYRPYRKFSDKLHDF